MENCTSRLCCHQKLCHIFFDWQHLWWVQRLYVYQTKRVFDKILIIRNIIESRYKYERLLSCIPKGFSDFLMKGKFDVYLLWFFGEKFIFAIAARSTVRNSTVGSAWKEECLSRNDFNPLRHGMGWPVIEMSALSPNYRVL